MPDVEHPLLSIECKKGGLRQAEGYNPEKIPVLILKEKNMKAELEKEDIEAIAQRVVELLKPMLLSNGKGEDIIFDVQGLAEYLKVNKQWVYDKVHQEIIPYHKAGKYPRFRKVEIDQWLNKKRKGNGKKPSNSVRRLLEPTL